MFISEHIGGSSRHIESEPVRNILFYVFGVGHTAHVLNYHFEQLKTVVAVRRKFAGVGFETLGRKVLHSIIVSVHIVVVV